MIIVNVLVILIFFSVFILAYIKIRYPFWSSQCVFHSYDFWRKWQRTPYTVSTAPYKTKYCDFENVKTYNYLECSQEEKTQMENIVQCYYLSTDRIMHTMNQKNLDAYLVGGREPSFISFYNENKYDISGVVIGNMVVRDIVTSQKPIGFLCSRYVHFFSLEGELYKHYPLYFMDFLSVHRERDYIKICRKLIQTHEYNQRQKNPSVASCLIKKEIELFAGVVPLVKYNTTTYNLRNNRFPRLPEHHTIVRITKENIDMLHDFFNIQTKTDARVFDICVFPDLGTLVELIQQNLLYVYCLQRGEDKFGYYFIKDAKTAYDDLEGASTLHCVTSFSNTTDERFFYLGFLHSLHDIVKYNRDYKMLLFDEVGHNTVIYTHWRKKYTPIFTSPAAYYLYNLIYPTSPLDQGRVFILV